MNIIPEQSKTNTKTHLQHIEHKNSKKNQRNDKHKITKNHTTSKKNPLTICLTYK